MMTRWHGRERWPKRPIDPVTQWPSSMSGLYHFFVSRNSLNILVKSVSLYLERFQRYGVEKMWNFLGHLVCIGLQIAPKKFQSTLNRYSVSNLRSSSTVKHDVNQSLHETSNNNELMLFCLANWRKKCKLANIGNIAFLRPALTTGVVMWPVKKKSLTQTT